MKAVRLVCKCVVVVSGALAVTLASMGAAGAGRGSEPTEKTGLGGVRGRISLNTPGVSVRDVAPLVVYLDAVEGTLKYEVPTEIPEIHQKNARFEPEFLVVAAGQTVSLPNDDRVVHNVFSFSKPNDFDLGLYPRGQTKKVTLRKPGAVDLFCSIHTQMNAVVFVAPSPYHAQPDAAGVFEISAVPPGTYKLKSWCRKLPEASRTIEVTAGQTAKIELRIETRKDKK